MSRKRMNRCVVRCAAVLIAVTFFAVPTLAAEKSLAGLPPNAVPGECYAKVFVPPKHKTVSERVLLKEASERVEIIPAQYGWIEETVMVEPASERLEVIPAQYKWVDERVVVKESSSRMETIPAKYKWVEERVLVKPSETVWKRGRGPIEKIDNSTGEILCLVEIPASYQTVRKQVMTDPASTRKVDIPPEYGTIKKKVLVSEATVKKVEVPAVYKSVKTHRMISPPQEKRITIPAEYQTVTRTEVVSEGRLEWARILCETNTTADFVGRVQRALSAAGFYPGKIDGDLGPKTMAAVNAFQRKNDLAVGALTYETVEKMGIPLR